MCFVFSNFAAKYCAMKIIRTFAILAIALVGLSSCGEYSAIQKTTDVDQKYEAAKQYYAEGYYNRAAYLLEDLVTRLKGSERGEESLFMLGMSSYYSKNYSAAASYFKKYYQTYLRGIYTEDARYYAAKALQRSTPESRLDQTATYEAVTEYSNFLDAFPNSRYREDAQYNIFVLQDKLVEKEYLAAKLYYDLGTYFGNCTNGGSNYQACIITAENAIKDFPYSDRREELSFLILRAKFDLAAQSVEERKIERYNAAIDEYYGFVSEYPESQHLAKAKELYEKAAKITGVKQDNE